MKAETQRQKCSEKQQQHPPTLVFQCALVFFAEKKERKKKKESERETHRKANKTRHTCLWFLSLTFDLRFTYHHGRWNCALLTDVETCFQVTNADHKHTEEVVIGSLVSPDNRKRQVRGACEIVPTKATWHALQDNEKQTNFWEQMHRKMGIRGRGWGGVVHVYTNFQVYGLAMVHNKMTNYPGQKIETVTWVIMLASCTSARLVSIFFWPLCYMDVIVCEHNFTYSWHNSEFHG